MLEEASAQVTQQAEALDKLGSDADSRAAELEKAQAQLSTALASLDTSKANLEESTELISSLKVENTGALTV
jgi:Tfp pilus assembly protein FimV